MRIIHLQDIFHPEAGYQENVISKYQALQGNDVYVVCSEVEKIPKHIIGFFGKDNIFSKDDFFSKHTSVNIIRLPVYFYLSGRAIYKEKIFKEIDRLKPDILFVHGNDTYIGIRYILKLKKLKYPIIFDNHMVEIASRNKLRKLYYFLYKKLVAPKIIKNNITVIRTENDNFVQNRLGVTESLSPLIQFGSDLLLFKPDKENKIGKRKALGIKGNSFVFIYAGKLDEYKGGLLLANAILKKFETKREIEFVIIGSFVGDYGKKVKEIMDTSENKVHFFSTQKYVDLPEFWQIADCALMPKECSTTFFDAQACGLPVIAEDIEINNDRLKNNNGVLYKKNSIEDFRNKIFMMEALEIDTYNQMSSCAVEYVCQNYNYFDIVQKINEEIFKSIKKWSKSD